MRHLLLPQLLLPLLLLAGCAAPPPEAYVSGAGSTKPEQQISLGANTVGEPCTQAGGNSASADIYCGTWQQPSGRVRAAGPADAASLQVLATSSPWRTGLSDRYDCREPRPASVLGAPALLMDCVRRIGGWPHIALVAQSGGQAWLADGVLPALPAIERSIAVLSGREAAVAASVTGSATLLAERLAAKSFSSGDVGQYDLLMQTGYRANLADNPVAAGKAYGAALALQEKALGRDNPAAADAAVHLALQLSLQGRYPEANALFARSARLAQRAPDALLPARVLHYQALHAMNQGRDAEALDLLRRAETAYADPRLIPSDTIRPRQIGFRNDLASSLGGSSAALADLDSRRALAALVDVRRYEAIVLRRLGREKESEEAYANAESLVSRSEALQAPTLIARLARTGAISADLAGNASASATALNRSNMAFARALPGTRPAALVAIMRGRELGRAGRVDDALESCRAGVRTLAELRSSVEPTQLADCLDAYATAADRDPGARQALLAEMFGAAQLAQSGITSQFILQATARLSENARDPRAAEAIRRREEANVALADAERRRETVTADTREGVAPAVSQAELDKQVTDARAAVLDAEAALQAASPSYNQLVQTAASAQDVLGALRPGEAFAAILLAGDSGWTFLLRDGTVRVAKLRGGGKAMDALVRRIRAGMQPANPMPPFDVAAAQALYDATLGAIPGGLEGAQALAVAPTGNLLSLPFGLLLTGPADPANLAQAPWLVRRVAVSHVPSAGNFLALRRVAGGSRARHPWFGFGDFRPVSRAQAARSFPGACGESAALLAGLPPLPGARRELETARAVLGAGAGDELLGPAFTATAVQRTNLKDYRVLHFATHALLPAELRCQSEPAIVASAPNGAADASGALLTASEINRMDLDAELVILSACNSGGPGGTTAGESLSGLARSFFYAGARALLVTHWEVNDQAAMVLVAATLAKMREQPALGLAGALRTVQLALLDRAAHEQAPELANPFFWAPFAVIGEGGGRAVLAGL